MNIFYINDDPIKAAQDLADDHIRKMQIESAQMLSTAYRISEGDMKIVPSKSGKRMIKHWELKGVAEEIVYKVAYMNHPSTKWTRQSIHHYRWLVKHGLKICEEFIERYGKEHKTQKVLEWLEKNEPNLPDNGFTPPPQCMPDIFKEDNTLAAYRRFYILDKVGVKKLDWKKLNNRPEWIEK